MLSIAVLFSLLTLAAIFVMGVGRYHGQTKEIIALRKLPAVELLDPDQPALVSIYKPNLYSPCHAYASSDHHVPNILLLEGQIVNCYQLPEGVLSVQLYMCRTHPYLMHGRAPKVVCVGSDENQ